MTLDPHRETERLLRTYPALCRAAQNLEGELRAASSLFALKRQRPASAASGASDRDEHLFDYDDGLLRLNLLRARIGRIEQALGALPETDRKILSGFFFGEYSSDTPFDLMEELGYEKSQLYRKRRKAVERFELQFSGSDIT